MEKGWEITEELDEYTGEVIREYRYRGKSTKRVLLDSRLSSHLAGYSLMEKDLRSVLGWLKAIEKLHTEGSREPGLKYTRSENREKYNLVKGLFVAALTFYGKCFTIGSGRPVTLNRKQVDKNYRKIHDECMTFRHNFAAHAGGEDLEDSGVALVITDEEFDGLMLFRELRQPDLLWGDEKEDSFLALVSSLHAVVKDKIDKINDKILREEVLPKGRDYWVKLAD